MADPGATCRERTEEFAFGKAGRRSGNDIGEDVEERGRLNIEKAELDEEIFGMEDKDAGFKSGLRWGEDDPTTELEDKYEEAWKGANWDKAVEEGGTRDMESSESSATFIGPTRVKTLVKRYDEIRQNVAV